MRGCAVAGVAAAILGRAPAVRAAPDASRHYDVPDGCPDADGFASEVLARAPSSANLAATSFDVTISTTTGRFEGRVTVRDEDGASPSRAVQADSCEEVVRALALVVAMTFDPDERPSAPVPAAAPPDPAPETAPDRIAPAPARLRFGVGARGGVTSAVGPLVSPMLGGYVALEARRFSLRMGVSRAESSIVERVAGSATFARTTGMVDACPLLSRGSTVSGAACAGLEVGTLASTGRDTVSPESSTRPWVAAGLAARLGWEPLPRFVLELEGRGSFPLVRDRFVFRPSDEVFETPLLAISAALTAGVRFP